MNFRTAFAFLLLLISAKLPGHTADNPLKLAGSARFDITATAEAGELTQGEVTRGDGTIGRKNWVPAAEQSRGYTVNFPLSRFAASEGGLEMLPIENLVGRAEFTTFSLDGSTSFNPLTWWTALRGERAFRTLRPAKG